ncbi:MAG: DUF2807 domain-containing protein [Bacteroidota bacterium]
MRIILTFFSCLLVLSLVGQSTKMAAFTKVELDGPVEVELVAGKERKVEVLREADMVMWEVNSETLVVVANHRDEREIVKMRITVTDLEVLETTGSVVVTGKGEFASATLELNIHGQSAVSMDVDAMSLYIDANYQSVLTLTGTADRMNVTADRQSVVNTTGLTSTQIKATADRQSVVKLNRSGAEVEAESKRQSVVN